MDMYDNMDKWRDGLLSDAEILGALLNEQDIILSLMQEVHKAMLATETKIADERIKKFIGSLGQ